MHRIKCIKDIFQIAPTLSVIKRDKRKSKKGCRFPAKGNAACNHLFFFAHSKQIKKSNCNDSFYSIFTLNPLRAYATCCEGRKIYHDNNPEILKMLLCFFHQRHHNKAKQQRKKHIAVSGIPERTIKSKIIGYLRNQCKQ